ncbi:MAG TPA: TlpA disulfide reductase family protein [Candidatus Baltobacteraceae bacterium]|nr:TlpA disulfide reductase family protein [Candidatus Baltobacteraceae bacterium]
MRRVSFVTGAAACAAAVPGAASALGATDPSPQPSASPSPRAEPTESPFMTATPPPGGFRDPGGKLHVHGRNGVVRIADEVPVEWKMEVLDGPEFVLSSYRGRVVVVNIFATWCGPCAFEIPEMIAFAARHADDTSVVGVDYHDEDDTVRKFRKKYAIPYPIAMDRSGRLVPGIMTSDELFFPVTIVFRPDGMLSCAWKGIRPMAWLEAERFAALATAAPSDSPSPAAAVKG